MSLIRDQEKSTPREGGAGYDGGAAGVFAGQNRNDSSTLASVDINVQLASKVLDKFCAESGDVPAPW